MPTQHTKSPIARRRAKAYRKRFVVGAIFF